MKLDNNAPLTIFELSAMAAGLLTQDRHHFFGQVKEGSGGGIDLKSVIGGTLPKLADGARIPMNKQTNNPALASPSVTAMKYFGALDIFKKAMDQIHAKKIAVFTDPVSGAGLNGFNFQNLDFFKQAGSLQSIVNKVMFGSFSDLITSGHHLEETMLNLAKAVGKGIGADEKTQINPATDTAKLMQGLASGFANGTNPFSSSVFSDGVTMAKEVAQYLKKLQS